MSAPVRTLALWLPDWPVVAHRRESGEDDDAPLAVLRSGIVVACSASARAEGVRRGLRRRDAQARCPSLRLIPDDPQRDERAFLGIVDTIEEIVPDVHVVRAGLCALRSRGPARYYGGEDAAAQMLCQAILERGLPDVRAGVADGLFTAEQAARRASEPGAVVVVDPGASREFLAPLPITAIGDTDLVDLLARLGVQTMGEFAALDADRVRGRLGDRGLRLHDLAGGRDSDPVAPRIPATDLAREIAFEPPLELADQVAFGVRRLCDEVVDALGAERLVCTGIRVELTDERGRCSERVWLHPTFFGAAEIVDRVRWQLEGTAAALAQTGSSGEDSGESWGAAIAHVRIAPDAVDDAAHHGPSLFGQGPGERVHHALSRVQALLGHRGVVVPAVSGGRWLLERQSFVPWGDRAPADAQAAAPWPGRLPAPLPVTVYDHHPETELLDRDGNAVDVDERGRLSQPPVSLGTAGRRIDIVGWAGPWPVREREWDPARARETQRLQLIDAAQRAWLVVLEEGRWWVEGRYD